MNFFSKKSSISKVGLFLTLLGLLLFSQCKKQQVYYYGDSSIFNLLSQDSLSFSLSFETKPYAKSYQDTVSLLGKCVLEGKADFFTDSTEIALFYNNKEVLNYNSGQIEIICNVNQQEKHFYYTDELHNIPTLLKDLTSKYDITNKEMYVKSYNSDFFINTMSTDKQITIDAKIKINKETVNKTIPILIEEREYHENDFPGAK